MVYLKVNLKKISPALIKFIAGSLKKGQTVILPTDTIYGFSCLATDQQAIRRLRRIKKKDPRKALAILVSDFKMLEKYAFVSRIDKHKLQKIWSGRRPTSVILNNRRRLPTELLGQASGVAVRLPKNLFLIKILKALQQPIVSTSLNLSGQEIISNPNNLKKLFDRRKLRPDLIIDSGRCRRLRPSRLLDLRPQAGGAVLRK